MPPTTAPNLSQFKKVGPPGSGAPDLSAFKKDKSGQPFRYQIPADITHADLLSNAQTDAAASKKESDSANSVGGFIGNFGKALVSNLASSEVGLGKTIATELDNSPTKAAQNISQLTNAQVSLIKQIRAKDAKGEDTTKLKQIYNSNQDLIDQQHGVIGQYAASVPSTLKVVGQLGGTALDLLSSGTYGKATAGMKTGELALPSLTKAVAPTAVKTLSPLGKGTGLFSLAGAGRIATGGGIGYAADVTQGLQGNRGQNRTGAAALIPGVGTAIGLTIPTLLEADKSLTNALDPDKYVAKRTQQFQDAIDRTVKTKNLDTTMTARGRNVAETLASSNDFIPEVKNGIINSQAAVNKVNEATEPLAKIVRAVVESEDKSIPFDDFQSQAVDELDDLKLRGDEYNRVKANVLKDMDFYKENYADADGNIPLTVIDDIKKAKYGEINWNNPDLLTADRAVSRSARSTIENAIPDAPIKQMNEELGKLYDAQEMLEALDGKAIKGGRLGKYFARSIGAAVGASHGPIGSVIGAMSADKIADLQQSSYFDNPVIQQAIGDIKAEQPEVFAQAQKLIADRAAERANRPLLGLPSSGGSSINQGRVIPVLPSEATGVEPSLMSRDLSVGNYKPPSTPPGTTGTPTIPVTAQLGEQYTPNDQLPTIEATPTGKISDAPPAEQAQFVFKTIQDHIKSSAQVLQNLNPVEIERLGGMKALLDRTKTNIADGLTAEGLDQAGKAIQDLKLEGNESLMTFFDKAMQAILGNAVK